MKNITKKSIEQDLEIIQDMAYKYKEAIYEKQEGQPAHFDNQSKLCRLLIGDIRCGLNIAKEALTILNQIEVKEDIQHIIAQTIVNKMQTEIGTDVKAVMSSTAVRDDFKFMLRKMTEEILSAVKE